LQNISVTITLMKYISLLFIFLLGGCSLKNYEHSQSKLIVFKSSKIKFADTGYIRNSDKSIALDMFTAGQRIERIEINHLICVSAGCMTKSSFNNEYLHPSYPNELLQNVLLGHQIYEGEGLKKTQDGFEQHIVNEDVEIRYKKTAQEISFKDQRNKILLKIKDL